MIPIRVLRAPVNAPPRVEPQHTSAVQVEGGWHRWTDEIDAELRRRWAAGQSGAVIAKALGSGLSRNAVIGRANRLGLKARRSPIVRGELWG